ncbi:MAG: Na/Pi cotransporter family protein [Bacilli bacterium]
MNPLGRSSLILAGTVTPIYIYVLVFLGGLGALLVGMRLLQEATEKLASSGLKKLFKKTANNKWDGVGIGTLATAIMQSSGATTVMVVGFVNAGVMSLEQATCYIMGANIGTTITAQIVALGGLSSASFPLTEIIVSTTIAGVILRMFWGKKHPKTAQIGDLIAGLGLLFLGIYVMTNQLTGIFDSNAQIKQVLTSPLTDNEFLNAICLLLIGVALTVVAQSSSAVTSIVLALAMSGAVIGGERVGGGVGNGVFYVILGSNIGSTSTALISAIGSQTNGKRASVIHLLFNLFGSFLFFVFLNLWPSFNEMTFSRWFENESEAIAMFHTFFNVFCTLIFLPFTKIFVWLAEKMVPQKARKVKHSPLLDPRFLETPELAAVQANTFYHQMAKLAMDDVNRSLAAFKEKDTNAREGVLKRESQVMDMSRELTPYIVNITSNTAGVSENTTNRLAKMELDIADIVRLSEIADNITGYTAHVVHDELVFSPVVYAELDQMSQFLNEQFGNCESIVDHPSLAMLKKTRALEDQIDNQRTRMVKEHVERLAAGSCNPVNSTVFISLVGGLERCGDHMNFISERSCAELLKKVQVDASQDMLYHP